MKNKIPRIGEISAEQFAQLEKTHGDIKTIEVDIDDPKTGDVKEISVSYLKRPDRDTVAMCLSLTNQDKPLQTGELILKNCFVGGDPRVTDPSNHIAISAAMLAKSIGIFYAGRIKN